MYTFTFLILNKEASRRMQLEECIYCKRRKEESKGVPDHNYFLKLENNENRRWIILMIQDSTQFYYSYF